MPSPITNPSFFPRRLSQYVPAMRYASDVNITGVTRISFNSLAGVAPPVALATAFLSAFDTTAAATTDAASLVTDTIADPWGRNVQVVLSGTGTGNVDVNGWDYLGQPMSERLALNGATPVLGLKAFKYIRSVTTPAIASRTLNLGFGALFGLPYKTIKVLSEESDGAVATIGTLVTPVLTSPATITTGDPRGTYSPNTTPDSAKVITATIMCDGTVNSSNVGGLHGVPHFSS